MTGIKNKVLLSDEWKLYYAENEKCSSFAVELRTAVALDAKGIKCIPAKVPGNFELDFINAGLLPDIYYADNILKLQEMENLHFWYIKEFNVEESSKDYFFDFEGIDTIADIYLNDKFIGRTDNMFISHKINTNGFLKNGLNELVIHIWPCVIESRKENFGLEVNTHQAYNAASLKIRKAAHSFGWDIMPRAISAGIWKDVYLANYKTDFIQELYLYPGSFSENQVQLVGYFRVEVSHDIIQKYKLKITGKCGKREFCSENLLWHNQQYLCILVDEPLLWWPRDMGEQNIYDVTAELFYEDCIVDTYRFNLGIKDIKLDITDSVDKDTVGNFKFSINGYPLFIRGTNWVPLDAFHSRDRERLDKALDLLLESKCNMVRCWGGNVYEDHKFFDFCDLNGILVWQDFAMGCAAYPQDDDFCKKLKTEAEFIVRKLRQHPSLAIWAGDNECDEATAKWSSVSFNPNENVLTRKILTEVLKRTDPKRPYLPSSPYISEKNYREELPTPEAHIWGPRDYCKNEIYMNAKARFASETGWHGCNSSESLRKFISPDRIWPWRDNPEWCVHASCMETKANAPYAYRIPVMQHQISIMFDEVPDNIDDFSLASQIVQAEGDKFMIERFRYSKWDKTGIIWWNLIDGWPQFSDAVVDYYYNKKLAFYYIKASQEPVCLMMKEPVDGQMTLTCGNEYLDDKTVSYRVVVLSTNQLIASGEITAAANSCTDVISIKCPDKNTVYLMEWLDSNGKHHNHYLYGKIPFSFNEYKKLINNNTFNFSKS